MISSCRFSLFYYYVHLLKIEFLTAHKVIRWEIIRKSNTAENHYIKQKRITYYTISGLVTEFYACFAERNYYASTLNNIKSPVFF